MSWACRYWTAERIFGVRDVTINVHLTKLEASLLFLHSAMSNKIIKDFACSVNGTIQNSTSIGIFNDEIESGVGVDNFKQLHDVGMIETFHDVHLSKEL